MGAAASDRRTAQLTVRMSTRVLRRIDRLARYVGDRLGMPATRTDVLREALLRGLAILEDTDERAPPESVRRE
jgi:hypothetical protein